MEKQKRQVAILRLTMALVLVGAFAFPVSNPYAHSGKPDAKVVLRQEMQKLWTDQVFWMREYIVASTAGGEETSAIGERLLRNAEGFRFAISRFYGIENSDKFADLLKAHVLIAFDVIEAAKAGDKVRLEAANQKWHANAADIATFLNNLNPRYWPKQCLNDTWDQHLALTMDEITARLQTNWKDDITAFEKDFAHILGFAECFADGIIKQFSSKFYSAG